MDKKLIPFIAYINPKNESQLRTGIVAESQDVATEFARNYFGDYRKDYRNKNKVEYLCSDFSDESMNIYVFTVEALASFRR